MPHCLWGQEDGSLGYWRAQAGETGLQWLLCPRHPGESAQTDGSSVWRWYLLSCCPPLILEEEGDHRIQCWLQLAALCILSLPPSTEKIRAGIAGKMLHATASPLCYVWTAKVGVLTHQLRQAQGFCWAQHCAQSWE